jgi:hypothetical protein
MDNEEMTLGGPSVPTPNEIFEITIIYQADGGDVQEDHYVGVKHIGMTQDGFFRIVTSEGAMVDYSIPRIIKRSSRVMEVSLV